ncbi:MAG TPA: (2Fe-2S)-binding protein, partial [Flavobacteriaceae bacterium]|nr:(2Fe-2S)-binding protein [Flavobacteriaceae bacterium]
MKKNIVFKLNGKSVSVMANGNETLLSVLRHQLEATGTKYGCGLGDCGACTVILDKDIVRSCMIFIEDVENKNVITIEGLSNNEVLHPIQQAFVENDALQCGFCTPGMIMNAYGFLLKNSNPTRKQVLDAMESNLCRCGSYNRIIDAILEAANQ